MIGNVLTKIAKLGHEIGESIDKENRRVILSFIEGEEGDNSTKILDLGCGGGELTKEIGEIIGSNELYGVEMAEKYAQLAEGNGIKVYRADLNKPLPIESETFDIVCANQVIEHLHQTDLFIKEIYRILKWGGGGNHFNAKFSSS